MNWGKNPLGNGFRVDAREPSFLADCLNPLRDKGYSDFTNIFFLKKLLTNIVILSETLAVYRFSHRALDAFFGRFLRFWPDNLNPQSPVPVAWIV